MPHPTPGGETPFAPRGGSRDKVSRQGHFRERGVGRKKTPFAWSQRPWSLLFQVTYTLAMGKHVKPMRTRKSKEKKQLTGNCYFPKGKGAKGKEGQGQGGWRTGRIEQLIRWLKEDGEYL